MLSKFGLQTLSFLHQGPTLPTHRQRAGQASRQLLESAGQRTTTALPTLRPHTQRLVMTDCGRPVWIGAGTTTTRNITAVVEGIELQRSGSLNAVAPHVGQGSKSTAVGQGSKSTAVGRVTHRTLRANRTARSTGIVIRAR